MLGSHRSKWSNTSIANQHISLANQTSAANRLATDRSSNPISIHDRYEKQAGSTGQDQANRYDAKSYVNPITRQITNGYSQLVTDRINDGWSCHLVTVLFSQLPGNRSSVLSIMRGEIQRVYSILLTRIHRKPRSLPTDQLPVLIGVADLPVFKRVPTTAPLVTCNGGLHFHAVLLVPPNSRMVGSIEEHISQNGKLYAGERRGIQTIHVKPVTNDHARVVDYVFKTILRGRVSYDEGVILLPRAKRELIA